MISKRSLLLTLDAFGTLFMPREPIAKQYGDVARRHDLTGFNNEDLDSSFRKAFKKESVERPNYGKAVGMKAPEWWSNVITSTFRPLVSHSLPDGLVPELLQRFNSAEGYMLYPDVFPLFQALRLRKKHSSSTSRVLVGILTNSDDRVPSILASFGLQVGPCRHGMEAKRSHNKSEVYNDIDFVALSYDIGFEKPHKRIFDAATKMVTFCEDDDLYCLHVGDDVEKDYQGAKSAGWEGVLLDRDAQYASHGINRIQNLTELQRYAIFDGAT